MFQFSRWLSLYWFILLPLVSWLATAYLYRTHTRNRTDRRASRWLLVAFIASQIHVSLLIVSSRYEVAIWPPVGALVAALILALAVFCTSMYPAGSFQEGQPKLSRVMEIIKSTIPFLLAIVIGGYVLSQQEIHWPGMRLILLALISPLLITLRSRKRLWLTPLLLLLIVLVFGRQSLKLRGALPSGHWSTLMTGASCSSTVQLELDRKHAWCTDESTGQVYRFSPRTGFIDQGYHVEYGSQTFSANANQAWIMQNPLRGLVLVENGSQVQVKINLPRQGALDPEGRLWVIDVSGFLWVSRRGEEWTRIKAVDGLLDNTARFVKIAPGGSVWVGSYSGVSILSPGETNWRYITRSDGIPGTIIGIAFGANGETWYLWERISAYQENSRWGVSRWDGYRWIHIELGKKTGLDIPSSQNAMAIDGLGRVWFVAPSFKQHTNYLGVITPYNGVITLYTLGPFELAPRGYPVPGFHGLLEDGDGGIFLYSPTFAPIRHWRPSQEYREYKPCPQPCESA
jgi:streptogramin lyase